MELLDHGERKFPQAMLTASSSGLNWPGIAAELRSHPAGDLPPFQPDQLEITLALSGEPDAVVSRKGAGVRQETRVLPHTIWISPPGVGEDDIRITRPLSRILHMYLPVNAFDTLCEHTGSPRFDAGSVRYLAGVCDGLIEEVGRALLAEITRPTPGGRLLAASMATTLTARLAQKYTAGRALRDGTVEGPPELDDARLRRVVDFMHAHLDEDIGLDVLAAQAGMSPFTFSRAFEARQGVPPHRHLAELRRARARRR